MVNRDDIDLTPFQQIADEQAARAIRLGKKEIFKWQRPIAGMSSTPPVLVYNREKTWMGQMPMSDGLASLFAGEYKFYAECVPLNTGQLYIFGFKDNQLW